MNNISDFFLNRIHEAELSLVNDVLETKAKDVCEAVVSSFQDISCFALQTLANIYSWTERLPRANEADRKALKLNPLLWHSFENLCQRGDFVDPEAFFNTEKIEDFFSLITKTFNDLEFEVCWLLHQHNRMS